MCDEALIQSALELKVLYPQKLMQVRMAEVDYLVANQELVRTASSRSTEDLLVARCKIEDNIH